MQFRVTRKDIKTGKKDNCQLCPVALAMKRALGAEVQVLMGKYQFQSAAHELPYKVTQFIKRFDDGLPVKPFSFNIPGIKKAK